MKWLLVLAPFVSAQEPALAPEREAILSIAQRFATVRWKAEERHAFHGEDDSGVRVDTPDVALDEAGWSPGEDNHGMPYCWGGFTSLETFEADLARDCWAGHVPARGNALSSRKTVGVDCSGFVSRCWDLPVKQSTRSLGALCYELDGYDQLQPGDIVNRFDAHVALFTGWADTEHTVMEVIEAARLRVEPSTYTVADLAARDFRPMRYKALDDRWVPMPGADAPTQVRLEAGGDGVFEPTGDQQDGEVELPASLRSAATPAGDWARYRTQEGALGASTTCTWMAVAGAPGTLELQRWLQAPSGSLATGTTLALDASWSELLVAFGNFSDPLRELEVIASTVEPGLFRIGGRALEARRVTALVEGQMLSRSTLYPVQLELDVVLADEIPLLGICAARLDLEVEYGMRGADRMIGRAEHRYALTAWGHRDG